MTSDRNTVKESTNRDTNDAEPKISGFSYIRNGFEYDYPFLEAFRSILPICDEFVVAVGDSTDGTREAIENLGGSKIKIIDTIWSETMRRGGKIFAQQANIALDNITGDWGFHIQADEVMHEDDLALIRSTINDVHADPIVDGLLFPFLNFYGSYEYIGRARRWHRYEVRAIRQQSCVRSFRDSQGFRLFTDLSAYERGEKGTKLRVKKVRAPVFHYNYVRSPESMTRKGNYFHRFWCDDKWLEENISREIPNEIPTIDYLEKFDKTHPKVMLPRLSACDWNFKYDPTRIQQSLKQKFLRMIESLTGWRIGEYKNYRLLS